MKLVPGIKNKNCYDICIGREDAGELILFYPSGGYMNVFSV